MPSVCSPAVLTKPSKPLTNAEEPSRSSRSRNSTLIEPTIETFPLSSQLPKILRELGVPIDTSSSSIAIQYSVHACPRQMKREVGLVFPDVVGKESDLLIIPTFQKTTTSMISYEAETQEEKDLKLHQFYRWGSDFVSRIREQGYWADITDPMSGMALFTSSGPSLYPDVESAEILLRYAPFNLGMCFVLSHPQWGTHVYPATAFTLAPVAAVKQVLYAMSLT